jgi:formylglycine-generating enzyme
MGDIVDLQAGGYHLTECIGTGGLGSVFRATVEAEGKPLPVGSTVAVRMLFPQLWTVDGFAKRFDLETALAAKLDHPNVCRVLEVVQDNGKRYVVMEYVEGSRLAEWRTDKRPLKPPQTIEIMSQVCQALDAASKISYADQNHCLVNRDIQPRNILIQSPDADLVEMPSPAEIHVKVLDFSFAKDLAGVSEVLWQQRPAEDKPAYMSPEQFRAEELDQRSDIYSLGVCAYEMIAGQKPFPGPSREDFARQHAESIPPAIAKQNMACPRNLADCIFRCLAKAPADRYQSPAELQRDLVRVRAGKAVAKVHRFKKRKPINKKKAAALAVAICLAALLACAGIRYFATDRAKTNLNHALLKADVAIASGDHPEAKKVLNDAIDAVPAWCNKVELTAAAYGKLREVSQQEAEANDKAEGKRLEERRARDERFAAYRDEGDKLVQAGKLEDAKVSYDKALGEKQDDAVRKRREDCVEKIAAEQKRRDEQARQEEQKRLAEQALKAEQERAASLAAKKRTEIATLLRDVTGAMEKNRYAEAEGILRTVLNLDPDNAKAIQLRKEVLRGKGLSDTAPVKSLAEQKCEQAKGLDRGQGLGALLDKAQVALGAARTLFDKEQYGDALGKYQDVIAECERVTKLEAQRAAAQQSKSAADAAMAAARSAGAQADAPGLLAAAESTAREAEQAFSAGEFDKAAALWARSRGEYGQARAAAEKAAAEAKAAKAKRDADEATFARLMHEVGRLSASWPADASRLSATQRGDLPNALGAVQTALAFKPSDAAAMAMKARIERYLCPPELTLDLGKGATMKLVLIRAGKFLMGSPDQEDGHLNVESPQREVTLAMPFHLGECEVTRGQFAAFVTASAYKTEAEKDGWAFAWDGSKWGKVNGASWRKPGFDQTDDHPVVQVSYSDAVAFCGWMGKMCGLAIRLPTEAEWEYACRAGSKTRFSFGDSAADLGGYAWHEANSGSKTHPVGTKKPNAFGLYDMHGNVWEWCSNWYGSYANAVNEGPTAPAPGALRVLRGGSWFNGPLFCRSAYRYALAPGSRLLNGGFRVAASTGSPVPAQPTPSAEGAVPAKEVSLGPGKGAPTKLAMVPPAGS